MKSLRWVRGLYLGACAAICCGTASAAVMVADTFEGGVGAWGIANGPSSSEPNAVGILGTGGGFGGGSALAVTADTTGLGLVNDLVFVNAASFGGSDFTTYQGRDNAQSISFDFYNNDTPSGLQLFFTTSGGTNWYYNFSDLPASTSWRSYSVMMTSENGWTDLGQGGNFAQDIQDVQTIGVQLQYLFDTAGQDYRIDNFTRGYQVPEPGTYAALGFAFLSLGVTFRRKLNDSVARMKSLLKG